MPQGQEVGLAVTAVSQSWHDGPGDAGVGEGQEIVIAGVRRGDRELLWEKRRCHAPRWNFSSCYAFHRASGPFYSTLKNLPFYWGHRKAL